MTSKNIHTVVPLFPVSTAGILHLTSPTHNPVNFCSPCPSKPITPPEISPTDMRISAVVADVLVSLPSACGFKLPEFKHSNSFSDSKFCLSSGFFRSSPSHSNTKLGTGLDCKSLSRSLVVRASSSSSGDLAAVAPVQFDSSVGQLLAQILQSHPHLLPAAIDQQLENLQAERDAQQEETQPSSQQDLLLYKRIAEVKEKERQKILEEIMYCLIVEKFVDKEISMIPKVSATSDPTSRVDLWPNQDLKLESVHSPEAFEMIQSHLSIVLGERFVGPLDSIVQISKIKLGKLYAASIMYGYFLKRVDERFQLERSMNTLPKGYGEEQIVKFEDPEPGIRLWDPDSLIRILPPDDGDGGDPTSSEEVGNAYRLRSYVMYLDAETLQRYATIRSKEAISLIEKQTQALFGRPDIKISSDGSVDTPNDEVVAISFSGLTMLVLEAVAFGSFLWDAESYIESKCHFLKS